MAYYRAEFQTSGIIMEYEGDSIKTLYDAVKHDLRWSLKHMDIPSSDKAFERVHFFREEDWGYRHLFLMSARHNDWYGSCISLLAPSNNWGMIWKEKRS